MVRSWLRTKLYGIRYLFAQGVPLPERPALNFIGATLEDSGDARPPGQHPGGPP